MYSKTIMRLVVGLTITSLLVGACAPAATPTPKEVEPVEQPTEEAMAPTEPPAEEAACPAITVADPQGVPAGEWRYQYELAEFEELAGCEMTFSSRGEFDPGLWEIGEEYGAPMLEGDLPPVEERVSEEPLVVQPYDEIGVFGGRGRWISFAPESGNSEFLSVRHVNLVRYAQDCEAIVPNVAKAYEWNEDYTTLTFWLRKGHKWSDGQPFTVDDILFWWDDIMLNEELFPTVPSQWVYGGEPLSIEKIDDYTFNVHFASPAPGFLFWMAKTWIQPWKPKHFMQDKHVKYNPAAADVATEEGYENWTEYFFSWFGNWQDSVHRYGLPKLESHILVEETTEYKVFAANPYYFKVDTAGNQLPYMDEIYQSYGPYEVMETKIINGEIDQKAQSLQMGSLPLWRKHEEDGDYSFQISPGVGMGRMYGFNCTHQDPVLREIFQNVKFNEAMSLALNRDEINKALCFDLCEPQQHVPSHPSNSYSKPEWFTYKTEYDPETANALLDEIGLDERDGDGFRMGPDGRTLVINLEYFEQAGNPDLHEMTKEYWEDVGVKVQLKQLTTEAYRTRASSNEHDVAIYTSGTVWEPMTYSNPYRLFPPFGDVALEPICGGPWFEWEKSGGASGEEPPEDVKQLFGMVDEWKSTIPGTDEYVSLAQQTIEIHRDNFWYIGTVSDDPRITILHNRLGNVPEITLQDWDLYRTYPYRPDQWFIKY
jgi:peptide/nickel transport system substrate-binding protein